jgi:hypothetical protein
MPDSTKIALRWRLLSALAFFVAAGLLWTGALAVMVGLSVIEDSADIGASIGKIAAPTIYGAGIVGFLFPHPLRRVSLTAAAAMGGSIVIRDTAELHQAFADACAKAQPVSPGAQLLARIVSLPPSTSPRGPFVVQVAAPDGGFRVHADFAGDRLPLLNVGDLVTWKAATYVDSVGRELPDQRAAWSGTITAKVASAV